MNAKMDISKNQWRSTGGKALRLFFKFAIAQAVGEKKAVCASKKLHLSFVALVHFSSLFEDFRALLNKNPDLQKNSFLLKIQNHSNRETGKKIFICPQNTIHIGNL